jgi:hypothetical protein
MGVIEDILKALDRIPLWKRLQQVPEEVDKLQTRVADLEQKLNGKWPGDVCRYCGARAARLAAPPRGQENWKCEECGQTDYRPIKR